MFEVHCEAQEGEVDATLALLPFPAVRLYQASASTEILDSLVPVESQPRAGTTDSVIVLLGSICVREIKYIQPEGYY